MRTRYTSTKTRLAMILMSMGCVLVGSGCTPEAKSAVDAGVKIAGAACTLLGKSDKFAKFACDIVNAGSEVLSKDGTGPQGYQRPPAVVHLSDVEVPLDEADAFARNHPPPASSK